MENHPAETNSVSSPAFAFPFFNLSTRHLFLLATVVLGGVILAVFGLALNFELLEYDSETYILRDYAIRVLDWDHIQAIFRSYYFINYNPLQRISYMIDYNLWGLEPAGFRTTNILLHWIATVFVFLFCYELTSRPSVAWLTSLVFAIHPTRVENVVWLAQRKDVLSAAFGFAAMWMYAKTGQPEGYRPPIPFAENLEQPASDSTSSQSPPLVSAWYLGSLLMYIGALASKAQWVPLCGAVVLLDVYRRRTIDRGVMLSYVPFFGLSLLFAWLAIDSQLVSTGRSQAVQLTTLEFLTNPLLDLMFYLKQVFWPVTLLPRHTRITNSPAMVLLSIILVGGCLAGMVKSWQQNRVWFFGFGWFLAFLAPMLNLVPGTILPADRYLYVSLVGLVFPLALWLSQYSVKMIWVTGLILTLFLGGKTLSTIPIWQNDLTLWTHITQNSESDQLALGNLMKAQVDAGQYTAARQTYERALARSDRYLRIFEVASILESKTGGDAGAPLLLGIQTTRYSGPLVARYGKHFLASRNYPEAEKWLTQAYTMDFGADTSLDLADLYVQTGQLEKALPYAVAALEANPFHPEAWRILGTLKLQTANQQARSGKGTDAQATLIEAAQMFQLSLQHNPDQAKPQIGLARIALQQKNLAEAQKWMRDIPVGRIPKARIPADGYLVWADIYRQQNQPFAALGTLIEATQVEDAPPYWLELARQQVSMRRDARPALERGFKQLDAKSQLELEQDPVLGSLVKELFPKVEKSGQLPQSK
ncbi:MAG: tetratricopeptide repeat protein [Acidobacteria bacterium]|nr:tetratricopeptide repeat protein [Acidobacteriota bacterium]